MRVLPVVRPVDQVAMDYDRIIAFVNSHDETTKGQIQHAHKITEARGTILYVFDIEKKQWCTTDTTEPTLYPRTMTLVTILDNTDDRIDMSIEAIGSSNRRVATSRDNDKYRCECHHHSAG